jgi:hypothetical protein
LLEGVHDSLEVIVGAILREGSTLAKDNLADHERKGGMRCSFLIKPRLFNIFYLIVTLLETFRELFTLLYQLELQPCFDVIGFVAMMWSLLFKQIPLIIRVLFRETY